jgi:hypothetical protein
MDYQAMAQDIYTLALQVEDSAYLYTEGNNDTWQSIPSHYFGDSGNKCHIMERRLGQVTPPFHTHRGGFFPVSDRGL